MERACRERTEECILVDDIIQSRFPGIIQEPDNTCLLRVNAVPEIQFSPNVPFRPCCEQFRGGIERALPGVSIILVSPDSFEDTHIRV